VLGGSVWAGLGGVFVEALLVASLYLGSPIARAFIQGHASYLLIGVFVFFFLGFGFSLQSVLEMQFWRGKWK
jgi:hypothetical protein